MSKIWHDPIVTLIDYVNLKFICKTLTSNLLMFSRFSVQLKVKKARKSKTDYLKSFVGFGRWGNAAAPNPISFWYLWYRWNRLTPGRDTWSGTGLLSGRLTRLRNSWQQGRRSVNNTTWFTFGNVFFVGLSSQLPWASWTVTTSLGRRITLRFIAS